VPVGRGWKRGTSCEQHPLIRMTAHQKWFMFLVLGTKEGGGGSWERRFSEEELKSVAVDIICYISYGVGPH